MASQTGGAVTGGDSQILDAGWTRGIEQTIGWADSAAGDGHAVLFTDAPLVVRDMAGHRVCEPQAGQRYGRWKVSVNTTNTHSAAARSSACPPIQQAARHHDRPRQARAASAAIT